MVGEDAETTRGPFHAGVDARITTPYDPRVPVVTVPRRSISSSRRSSRGRAGAWAGWGLLVTAALATASCDRKKDDSTEAVAPRQPASPRAVPGAGPLVRVTAGRYYVPTYSHIYVREGIAEDLAVTLSIRNVSVNRELVLDSVHYYDTGGKLLENFMDSRGTLRPLETVEFFIPTNDRRGGSGANAIVSWHADSPIVPPLVEAVMVRSISANQAYSFTTRGIEIPTDVALPEQPAPEAPEPAPTPEASDEHVDPPT